MSTQAPAVSSDARGSSERCHWTVWSEDVSADGAASTQ